MKTVDQFGARGDGAADDTAAVQSAIDACSAEGQDVVFPSGRYLCAGLTLRSHTHLCLQPGAVLCANPDTTLYPAELREAVNDVQTRTQCFFLFARDCEDLQIFGGGTVLGCGQADFGSWWGIPEAPKTRIGMLLFDECRDVVIRDVRFLYSEFWTLHLRRCEDVRIDGITIRNNFKRLNTDGIDPDSCRNVIISNCNILTGDDCIVAKTEGDAPMENLVVQGCLLQSPCTALKIGTGSVGDFRDIHVSGCVIRHTAVGIGIYIKDGGTAERISFSGISIENWDIEHVKPVFPLFVDIERRHADSPIGRVRDVLFSGIQIHSPSSSVLQGMPERPLENITLTDITHRVPFWRSFEHRKKAVTSRRTTRGERDTLYVRKPAYAAFAHIDGLTLRNYRVLLEQDAPEPRSAAYFHDVARAAVADVWLVPGADEANPLSCLWEREECE